MRDINRIVVHCTDTKHDHDVTVNDIDIWHKARKFKMIGYHYLIRLDGKVEFGRPVDMVGAHARGFNKTSIGIAYAGGIDKDGQRVNTMTEQQTASMFYLIESLVIVFGDLELCGHNDLTDQKTCPNFDVGEWWLYQNENNEIE